MGIETAILGAAGLSAVGSVLGARSADKAASAQKSAARNQLALQERVFEEGSQNFEPFLQGGTNALGALLSELGLGDAPEGFNGLQASPAALFALQQGRDQIEAGAAARGGLNSGATLQALEDLRFGLAAQDRETQLNRLAQLAGLGQASAGQQAALGQNFATNAGDAFANIGNAQAAGQIGVSNAISGGLNNLGGLIGFATALNRGNDFGAFAPATSLRPQPRPF